MSRVLSWDASEEYKTFLQKECGVASADEYSKMNTQLKNVLIDAYESKNGKNGKDKNKNNYLGSNPETHKKNGNMNTNTGANTIPNPKAKELVHKRTYNKMLPEEVGFGPGIDPCELRSVDPMTQKVVKEYKEETKFDVQNGLNQLEKSFKNFWSQTTIDERVKVLETIEKNIMQPDTMKELGVTINQEMGRTVNGSGGFNAETEAPFCSVILQDAIKNGKEVLNETHYNKEKNIHVTYSPLGTILLISPWNGPVITVLHSAGPIWMTGNTIVCKPSPHTIGCVKILEKVINNSMKELYPNKNVNDLIIFKVMTISANRTEEIVSHKSIRGAIATGSVRMGKSIMSLTGKYLKKCVLELGGNDGWIVCDDCNLDETIEKIVAYRLINTGQICIAPKRLIVFESILEKFEEKLIQRVKKAFDYEFGQHFSVLQRAEQKLEVTRQVKIAIEEGAKLLFGDPNGGNIMDHFNETDKTDKTDDASTNASDPGGDEHDIKLQKLVGVSAGNHEGVENFKLQCRHINDSNIKKIKTDEYLNLNMSNDCYYNPLILTNIKKGNLAYEEEIFGPIFSILPVKNLDDAIDVFNDSDYGLGGAICTTDLNKGFNIAKNFMDTGGIGINDSILNAYGSSPFGGVKQSGVGRAGGREGIMEWVNIKTIIGGPKQD